MPPKKLKKPPKPKPDSTTSDSSTIVQITASLYLGPHTATKPCTALAAGIAHMLSIGAEPVSGSDSLTCTRISLLDTVAADIINSGGPMPGVKVLVHCVAAVSGSAAVLAAHLIQKEWIIIREARGCHLQRTRF
ncbi:hypothetical protein BJ170DRAFT_489085 [Xylariales sp. AK1849]|nr:hypothetical protein BJ170DRAFT_489085 [Xylariales sp. AK1849]